MLTQLPTCVILTDDTYACDSAFTYFENGQKFNRANCTKAQLRDEIRYDMENIVSPTFQELGRSGNNDSLTRVEMQCKSIPQGVLGQSSAYKDFHADLFIIAVNPVQLLDHKRAAHLAGVESMCLALKQAHPDAKFYLVNFIGRRLEELPEESAHLRTISADEIDILGARYGAKATIDCSEYSWIPRHLVDGQYEALPGKSSMHKLYDRMFDRTVFYHQEHREQLVQQQAAQQRQLAAQQHRPRRGLLAFLGRRSHHKVEQQPTASTVQAELRAEVTVGGGLK